MNPNQNSLNNIPDHTKANFEQAQINQQVPPINYNQLQLPQLKFKDGAFMTSSLYRQKLINKLNEF